MFYIHKHQSFYNQILLEEFKDSKLRMKRSPEDYSQAFGLASGTLKKARMYSNAADNVMDFCETEEDLVLHNMRRRLLQTPAMAALFDSAEADGCSS